jgi:regulator of cell morphogenesis and NO signaling
MHTTTAPNRSLVEWVDHVIAEYHRPLPGELAHLDELTAAAGDAARPQVWAALRDDLLQHIAKEERVLFPSIRSGRGASAGAPIQVMTQEHHESQAQMVQLAAAAQALRERGAAPGREWAEAYLAFDARLREHMRLEEEELFPRALMGGE